MFNFSDKRVQIQENREKSVDTIETSLFSRYKNSTLSYVEHSTSLRKICNFLTHVYNVCVMKNMTEKKTKKPLTKKQNVLIITLCAVVGVVVGGGAGFLLGHLLKTPTIDMSNVEIEEETTIDMVSKYEKCKEEGKDPLNEFSYAELISIGSQKLASQENYVCWGYGFVNTAVCLDILNVSIKNGSEYMEESLSKSLDGSIMNVVVCQRDYQHGTEKTDKVDSYLGNIPSKINNPDFSEKKKTEYTVEEYEKRYGKPVSMPCVYIITDNTVLSSTESSGTGSSYAKKTDTGYEVMVDLDPIKSVARYYKRMVNLSNSTVSQFFYIHLTFTYDNNFNLISQHIEESYRAGMGSIGASVIGTLDTYFFSNTQLQIPSIDEKINYPEKGAQNA